MTLRQKAKTLDLLVERQGADGMVVIYLRNGMQIGGRIVRFPAPGNGVVDDLDCMFQLEATVHIGHNDLGPMPADMPPFMRSEDEAKRIVPMIFSIEDVVLMSPVDKPPPRRAPGPTGLSPAELAELGITP